MDQHETRKLNRYPGGFGVSMKLGRSRFLGVPKSTVYYKARDYPEAEKNARKQLCEQMKGAI